MLLNCSGVIKVIADTLFQAEQRRLNGVLINLNKENKKLKQTTLDGFTYLGTFFLPVGIPTTVAVVGQQMRTVLDFRLYGQIEAYQRDCKTIVTDMALIRQTLFHLLNPCGGEQDIRDALPECLVDCVPHICSPLTALARTNEPAWTIRDNPRALRQYEKILPKMEIYSAARLIY